MLVMAYILICGILHQAVRNLKQKFAISCLNVSKNDSLTAKSLTYLANLPQLKKLKVKPSKFIALADIENFKASSANHAECEAESFSESNKYEV